MFNMHVNMCMTCDMHVNMCMTCDMHVQHAHAHVHVHVHVPRAYTRQARGGGARVRRARDIDARLREALAVNVVWQVKNVEGFLV